MSKPDRSEPVDAQNGHDSPMTLTEAAQRYGLPSKSTIVTEEKRGNIKFTWLANQRYVTERDMLEMFERCRGSKSHRASTSDPGTVVKRFGSSETATMNGAQVAALNAAKKLKKRLPPT